MFFLTRPKIITDPDKLIFAMDIGTRSVVGIICYPENEKLRVLTSEVAFHPQRDMLDGQIQNIEEVVKTSRQVKEKLEKRLGIELKRVAVAAAGRALITRRYLLEKEIPSTQKIRQEEIASWQLEAVEQARQTLAGDEAVSAVDRYYCVGYTTVAFYLDKYPITSLAGQRGSLAGIEILATFLPQVVIDSLLTVVEKMDLTVHNLTLEPIAALNVTIPPEYRSLNLALVDVGAGTSDIAITHKGSVTGYAMVPLAGDEISEHIAETYLLDFNTAESVKLSLTQKKANISFKDILGNSYNLPAEEILTAVEPAVEGIAAEITSTIKKYNNGPPRAVFLVGGGSQTPFLREKIAEKLELPLKMVAIRGREIVRNVLYTGNKLKGPESITPLGIAVSALQKDYFGFSYLTVNGKVVRLLDTENLKVGNALIAAGFSPKRLLGRRGPGVKILLNGKEKVFPGNAGENAAILVNGEKASLETIVKNNDKIEVQEAREGTPRELKIFDILPQEKNLVFLNGQPCPLPLAVSLNGEKAAPEKLLKSGDRLEWQFGTLRQLLELADLQEKPQICKINGLKADLEQKLNPGDRITVQLLRDDTSLETTQVKDSSLLERKNFLPEEKGNSEIRTKQENENIVEKEKLMLTIHANGKEVHIPAEPAPSFVNIFDYINFDRSKPRGKLVMTHNGQPASLTGKLKNGDVIAVFWESKSEFDEN